MRIFLPLTDAATAPSAVYMGPLQQKIQERVKRSFKAWRKKMFSRAGSTTLPLVKDFGGFLRQAWNFQAEEDAGPEMLAQHPKLAADPNAIESIWDVLQDRLLLTAPAEMESPRDFIKCLRRTVTWMNTNARAHVRGLCRNQKNACSQGPQAEGLSL